MACSQGKSGKAGQAMEGIEYLSGQADHGGIAGKVRAGSQPAKAGKLGQAVQESLADKSCSLGRPGMQVRPGSPGKPGRQGKHANHAGKACNLDR